VDVSIFHPEAEDLILRINEQHTVISGQVLAECEPAHMTGVVSGNLCGQCMPIGCYANGFVVNRTCLPLAGASQQ